MKFNFFGEPVPSNFDEIEEALMLQDMVLEECSVIIDFEEEEGDFHGFSATVTDHSQDRGFTTTGFLSKEVLLTTLLRAGLRA